MPFVGGIVTVVLVALARPLAVADGGPIPLRISWEAPAGCADAESFWAGLAARAARVRRAAPGEAAVAMEVRLARVAGKVRGTLRLLEEDEQDKRGKDRSDERDVSGATCEEVAEALSLTAAIAIGTSPRWSTPTPAMPTPAAQAPAVQMQMWMQTQLRPSTSPPAGASPAPSSPALVSPGARSPASASRPTAGLALESPSTRDTPTRAFAFALAVGADVGQPLAPHLGVGGSLGARLSRRSGNELGPSAGLSLVHLRDDLFGSQPGLAFRWTAGEVTVCPGWGVSGIESAVVLELCGLVVGGWLSVWDTAVDVRQSAGRSWWSAGAVARARALLAAGLSLQVEVGGSIPLASRRFVTTTPDETVGQSPFVSSSFRVALAHDL